MLSKNKLLDLIRSFDRILNIGKLTVTFLIAGQCTETYCPKGTLTGNADRTTLALLTCDAKSQWVDAQSVTYTTAQCEIREYFHSMRISGAAIFADRGEPAPRAGIMIK